ncbi:hypothetical protein FRC10_005247 [Ceratobasidium sp. 414]|nr:hypothetical protein FRC10_005247 [Ceratobasidium sp. 414]
MRLDTTFLVGVWLEALVYGIYVAAFVVCLRLFRTRTPSVGRALPVWVVVLFILATAHCALSLSATLDAFVRQTYPPYVYTLRSITVLIPLLSPFPPPPFPSPSPSSPGRPAPSPSPGSPSPSQMPPRQFHDPNFYISNRALPTNLASLGVYAGIVLVSDLMLLYRLLVMYRYKFVWTIGPAVLTVASFAISMVVVTKYSHIDLSASKDTVETQLAGVDPWVPPVYAVSFLASLSIAALMMVGASFATSSGKPTIPAFARPGRRHVRQTSLTAGDGFVFDIDERTGPVPVPPAPISPDRTVSHKWIMLARLVESGVLAPVFMLAALILYVVQGGQETLLVPLLSPIAALVPTLQIIQIQLGLDSSARYSSPAPGPAAPEVRTSLGGRSPYLVPAPRYRDSFSSSEDEGEDKVDVLNRNLTPRESGKRPPVGRPWSARWGWRGSGSASGSGSHERSLSGSSGNGRLDPTVALPMQDLSSRPAPKDDQLWERIKFDDPAPAPAPKPTSPPRRSTLRKSGTVVKEMISKPVPVAADFPPSTAAIPSTAVPALPSFTITGAQGGTVAKAPAPPPALGKVPSLSKTPSGNLGRTSSGKDKNRDVAASGEEHKYHYRMRPREKTANHLAAYLNAQAIAQQEPPAGNPNSEHLAVGSASGHPGSNLGHANLMSLPSTVPTSPASGFTSLAPNPNPFRYDAATPPPPQPQPQPQPQSQHRRSYSDVQRGDAPSSQPGIAGIGLAGAHRAPLTFPFAPNPESETVPRWGALPGAPYIPGLGGTKRVERDVSPAPGLQQDYARARGEVLRQMRGERTGGAMSDDESVYSTQPMSGAGWKSFPAAGR